MHKELFSELVKLASVKVARGAYDYYGGSYGGGRVGGGRNMYLRTPQGSYMGTYPQLIPGMVRGQNVQVTGMEQMLPEQRHIRNLGQQGLDYKPEAYNLATDKWQKTFEGKEHNRLNAEIARREVQLQESRTNIGNLEKAVNDAAGSATAAREAMLSSPASRAALNASEGHTLSMLGKWAIPGSEQPYHDYRKAKRDHAVAKANYNAQKDRFAQIEKEHKNYVDTANEQRTRHGAALGGMSAEGRTLMSERDKWRMDLGQKSVQDARNLSQGGRGAMLPPKPPESIQRPKGPPLFEPVKTPPLLPHNVGRNAPPVPPGPQARKMPPIGEPVPHMAAAFMPLTSMDNLIEGAARNMFNQYVKIANAKLAVKTTNHLRVKRGNSMMGLDPGRAAELLGHGGGPVKAPIGHPDSSQVNLAARGKSTVSPPGSTSSELFLARPTASSDITESEYRKHLEFMRKQNSPEAIAEAAAFKANAPRPPANVLAQQRDTRVSTEKMIAERLARGRR